jgi:hypothetical protein
MMSMSGGASSTEAVLTRFLDVGRVAAAIPIVPRPTPGLTPPRRSGIFGQSLGSRATQVWLER